MEHMLELDYEWDLDWTQRCDIGVYICLSRLEWKSDLMLSKHSVADLKTAQSTMSCMLMSHIHTVDKPLWSARCGVPNVGSTFWAREDCTIVWAANPRAWLPEWGMQFLPRQAPCIFHANHVSSPLALQVALIHCKWSEYCTVWIIHSLSILGSKSHSHHKSHSDNSMAPSWHHSHKFKLRFPKAFWWTRMRFELRVRNQM